MTWTLTIHPPEMYGPSYTISSEDNDCIADDSKYYPTAPSLEQAKLIVTAVNEYLERHP